MFVIQYAFFKNNGIVESSRGGKKSKPKTKKGDKKDEKAKLEPSERDQKIKEVFDALLDKIKFEVSPLLIEEETNNQLNRLAGQIQKLGLNVEDYLKSMKTDIKKLRAEYDKTSEENLKLEFILHEIGLDANIKADKKDFDKILSSVGDETVKQRIMSDPREMASIEHMLTKQKVVDAVLKGDL